MLNLSKVYFLTIIICPLVVKNTQYIMLYKMSYLQLFCEFCTCHTTINIQSPTVKHYVGTTTTSEWIGKSILGICTVKKITLSHTCQMVGKAQMVPIPLLSYHVSHAHSKISVVYLYFMLEHWLNLLLKLQLVSVQFKVLHTCHI